MFMLNALRRGGSDTAASIIDGTPSESASISLLPNLDSALLSRTVDVSTIYRTNPWLYAVVGLIARSYSRMPPKVYRRDGEGDQVRANARGATLEAALRRPGAGVSWQTLQRGTARDKLLRGNALWRVHADGAGIITGFERIPWRYVRVAELDGELLYTDQRHTAGDSRHHSYLAGDVIHFGLHEDDTAVADSPVQSLRSTLALFDAVYVHLLAYFGNSARPSGYMKVDPRAGEPVITAVSDTISSYFKGPQNAGRVLVTSAEWQDLASTPDQSKVIELAKQSREEICGVYGVAPPLVGILDRAIMSNVRELREHTTRDTVGPYVEDLDGAFNAQMSEHHPLYRQFWRETETAATLKADLEGAAATYPNQLRIMTPNELRQRKGLKALPDPEADKLWYPNGASDSSGAEGAQGGPAAASFRPPTQEGPT